MLKEKFSILSASNLIFLLLGVFLASGVIFIRLFSLNRPLNYAYISQPLDKITTTVIPTVPVASSPSLVQGSAIRKVDINTASLSDLDRLPRIGPVTAQKIIGGRPYQRIEDLVIKKAVTRTVFEQIKGQIVVN